MNEEEIIEILKSPLLKSDGYERHQKAIDGILDLYQIEKEKNAELTDKLTLKICQGVEEEVLEEYRQKLKNSISKDKIKARIEELEKSCNICHFRGSICKDFKAFNQCTFQVTIKNLQSLLEEE